MSGCPVHIWAPMMGAALPMARVVRDKVRWRGRAKAAESTEATAHPVTRWPALGTSPTADEEPSA
jgi:hypothetical protein